MGIILTAAGLPLLTSTGRTASRADLSGLTSPVTSPVPVPKPGDFPLQGPTTSISYRGVTFTFSKPIKWLASANGDPVVITHPDHIDAAGTSILSITPGCVTDANGHKANGAMKNHHHGAGNVAQSFDGLAGKWPEGWRSCKYVDAGNVDPGNTGAPIQIRAGESCSIIKSVRAAGATTSTWKSIDKYVVLTFMGSLPPRAGTWFRPNVSTPTKAWPGRPVEEMDFSGLGRSPLRNLPRPSVLQSPSVYRDEIAAQETRTVPVWMDGTAGRVMQVWREIPNHGYAKDLGERRGEYACSLFADPGITLAQNAARKELAITLIQWGIDTDGGQQMGHGANGAGQHNGFIEFHYIAAFFLGDAAMLARAQDHNANIIGQCGWVTEDAVGQPSLWNWGSTAGNWQNVGQTFQAEHVGMPEWSINGPGQNEINYSAASTTVLNNINPDPHSAYRDVIQTCGPIELFSIGLLLNGPVPGVDGTTPCTGIEALNGNEPPQPGSRHRTAALPTIDRMMSWSPWQHEDTQWLWPSVASGLLVWRDHIPQARWTGRPDINANQKDLPNFKTGASAGEIDWRLADWTRGIAYDYATRDIAGREIEVSQDNVQFVRRQALGAAISYTYKGLRAGTAHWCRWRQTDDVGRPSAWSPTFPMSHNQAGYNLDRGKVTSGGVVPGGGYANQIAPAICFKPYPKHQMPYFEQAPANLRDAKAFGPGVTGVTALYAGIGYWTGGSAAEVRTAATYGWQRSTNGGASWSSIGTGQAYTLQGADSGSQIRCEVTVGGVKATSNAVTVP